MNKEYKASIVDAAIAKAKAVPRSEALKKVFKTTTTNRPVFVVRHDPRLPSINKIIHKHYRSMTQDPYMAEVFPEPPLVAYTRPKNIRDFLIRARLPSKTRQRRKITGMKRCKENCIICPYVNSCKSVKSTHTVTVAPLTKEYDCQTQNLIYLVHCKK